MGNWIKTQTNEYKGERPKISVKEEPKPEFNSTATDEPELFTESRKFYKTQYVKKRTILLPNLNSLDILNGKDSLDVFNSRGKDKARECQQKKNSKSNQKNDSKVTLLLEEWAKDRLKVWYDHCFNLLTVWDKEDLLHVRDQYLNESVLHLCCTRSHLDLFDRLLSWQPELTKCKDIDGNTPFHSLWRNTTSNEWEMISMFNFLKALGIDVFETNKKGITGLDILEFRVTDPNPYDNIQSVKLLYQYIFKSFPEDIQKQLKIKYKMWNSDRKNDRKWKGRKLSEYDRRSFSENKLERRIDNILNYF